MRKSVRESIREYIRGSVSSHRLIVHMAEMFYQVMLLLSSFRQLPLLYVFSCLYPITVQACCHGVILDVCGESS